MTEHQKPEAGNAYTQRVADALERAPAALQTDLANIIVEELGREDPTVFEAALVSSDGDEQLARLLARYGAVVERTKIDPAAGAKITSLFEQIKSRREELGGNKPPSSA